jgi:hypothetical protein
MPQLSTPQQALVGVALALLMAVTRGQHLTGLGLLPDASWAVFFLAGVYLRPAWAFLAYLAEALILDVAAITWGGVSGFCFTPAYTLLLPAHGALWLAGRWYAGRHHERWPTLLPLIGAVLGAAAVAELLASGGFYLFSGRFEAVSLAGLGTRLVQYFPSSLEALALYVGLTAVVHATFALARGAPRRRDLTAC